MWNYSSGTQEQLAPQLFQQIGHYRRQVFIEQLGWQLQTVDGMELDEFDGPDAIYVCAHDDHGRVSGVARLLPTTAPYLLEKVFPSLWGSGQVPRDPRIWELSRFAAATNDHSGNPVHQASAQHASELLRNVMRTSRTLGAQALVSVTVVGMERLLRVNGFRAMRAGTPCLNHGTSIVALQIPCD